jgi:hypothetical protein
MTDKERIKKLVSTIDDINAVAHGCDFSIDKVGRIKNIISQIKEGKE